jgi:cytochrome P450
MYMRGKLGKSLLDLTGSEWKRVRTLMNPFFSTRKLKHVRNTLCQVLTQGKRFCEQIAEILHYIADIKV